MGRKNANKKATAEKNTNKKKHKCTKNASEKTQSKTNINQK